MKNSSDKNFIELLVTNQQPAHNKISNSLKPFGQFIGNWEWSGTDYDEKGNETPTKGKWVFQSVLNGNAIQDVFIFENQNKNKDTIPFLEFGTTIRFPNKDGETWTVVWAGPINKITRNFIAKENEGEIIMEGKNEKGNLINWIFSEITEDSFRWRGELSEDNGNSWIIYEELLAKRISGK